MKRFPCGCVSRNIVATFITDELFNDALCCFRGFVFVLASRRNSSFHEEQLPTAWPGILATRLAIVAPHLRQDLSVNRLRDEEQTRW